MKATDPNGLIPFGQNSVARGALRVIMLKSRREIDLMCAAGRLVAQAHQIAREMIQPGITTNEIDKAVEVFFLKQGATPLFKGVPGKVPYPAVTCISINEQVVHGIPGNRKLQEGDLVSFDTACRLDGWCGDAAWTYPVGPVNALKQKLLESGKATLSLAIREMGRRQKWSEVATVMQETVRQAGFQSVEAFVGHGIGREMHEDPQVPNIVNKQLLQNDFRLEPGLTLAVEPMINAGTKRVKILADHWTVITKDRKPSVHFEHTIALTTDGPKILTAGVGG